MTGSGDATEPTPRADAEFVVAGVELIDRYARVHLREAALASPEDCRRLRELAILVDEALSVLDEEDG